ncbi:MAG: hypothetical protein AAF253_12040 [Pseudomonadota bacterium]
MQYAFDFSPGERTFAQLVIGRGNRQAVDMLQPGAPWPASWLCLVGPPRCGRTCMASIWAAQAGGRCHDASGFNSAPLIELDRAGPGAIAIDDAHLGLDDDRLLHVLNAARSAGGRVLLTAAIPPVDWPARQPDLLSRLRAMTVVMVDLPDPGMDHDLLEAACHRRYIGLPDDVWSYLEKRIPRDYAAIEALAEELCDAVSGTGRGLTVPVARQVLGDTGEFETDDEETDN